MLRRHQAVSVLQASESSPTLARLTALVRESSARLDAIRPLLPPGLRNAIQAGPVDETAWCLLVNNNAAAAKLRQLLPSLEAHLRAKGWPMATIRLKVQGASRH